ncbi:MAG: HupE/UreJ family protein [Sphingomonas sp.]|uniref:HupE/UreJ family protein n=1 Tax=Sphingomonas sp. TaxID=28214 RepID=UPI0018590CE1|nr:HupE/UreJ family protein [Sphingomonas sp.]MBA3667387.1 HupE/UreJ family protein [Sphingomonas sp.]
MREDGGGNKPQRNDQQSQFHKASLRNFDGIVLNNVSAPVQTLDAKAQSVPTARRVEEHCARAVLGVVAIAALIATPAEAHDGTGLAGGFVAGVLHPLEGPDHLLAMVSVGLWGAFLGRPLIYALPMLFPAAMAVGGAVGMAGVGLPPVELGIAVSVVTLGLMILFAVRAPIAVACAIVGTFALFHGYAHGAELPSAADPVGYSAGFVLCTGFLHLVGIGLGLLRGSPAGTIALRAAGGAIALAGGWFLISAVMS